MASYSSLLKKDVRKLRGKLGLGCPLFGSNLRGRRRQGAVEACNTGVLSKQEQGWFVRRSKMSLPFERHCKWYHWGYDLLQCKARRFPAQADPGQCTPQFCLWEHPRIARSIEDKPVCKMRWVFRKALFSNRKIEMKNEKHRSWCFRKGKHFQQQILFSDVWNNTYLQVFDEAYVSVLSPTPGDELNTPVGSPQFSFWQEVDLFCQCHQNSCPSDAAWIRTVKAGAAGSNDNVMIWKLKTLPSTTPEYPNAKMRWSTTSQKWCWIRITIPGSSCPVTVPTMLCTSLFICKLLTVICKRQSLSPEKKTSWFSFKVTIVPWD